MTDVDLDLARLEEELGRLQVLVIDLDAEPEPVPEPEFLTAVSPHWFLRLSGRLLNDTSLLMVIALVGMASVYLINGFIALAQPEDFRSLVDKSLVTKGVGLEGVDWITGVIAFNDLALGVLLLAVIPLRRWRYVALAWSGVWLFVITLVKLFSLNAVIG